MELRDYLHALRRSWLVVTVVAALGLVAAALLLAVLPKQYEATSGVVILANAPDTIPVAQQGAQLAIDGAQTAAAIISSPLVLNDVARALNPRMTTDDVVSAVTAAPRLGTSVIDITATAATAELATDIANRTADTARAVVPVVQGGHSAAQGGPIRLEIVRRATVPGSPVSPNTGGTVVIGLLAGLALGIALAIIRYSFDTRIREAGDLRRHRVPILAVLPGRARSQRSRLIMRDQPSSAVGEAFRTLRTNLGSVGRSRQPSYLLVPVGRGDDVGMIAAELGWSLAAANRRTVVADLDLHHPSLGAVLRIDETVGAAEALAGQTPEDVVVASTEHPGLSAVVAGSVEASPSDLLSSRSLPALITELERRFDRVILKAPPLLAYTDAAVIARHAGGVVVVVRADHDTRADVTAALDALENIGVQPFGLVLDSTRVRRTRTRPQWLERLRRYLLSTRAAQETRRDEPHEQDAQVEPAPALDAGTAVADAGGATPDGPGGTDEPDSDTAPVQIVARPARSGQRPSRAPKRAVPQAEADVTPAEDPASDLSAGEAVAEAAPEEPVSEAAPREPVTEAAPEERAPESAGPAPRSGSGARPAGAAPRTPRASPRAKRAPKPAQAPRSPVEPADVPPGAGEARDESSAETLPGITA